MFNVSRFAHENNNILVKIIIIKTITVIVINTTE